MLRLAADTGLAPVRGPGWGQGGGQAFPGVLLLFTPQTWAYGESEDLPSVPLAEPFFPALPSALHSGSPFSILIRISKLPENSLQRAAAHYNA